MSDAANQSAQTSIRIRYHQMETASASGRGKCHIGPRLIPPKQRPVGTVAQDKHFRAAQKTRSHDGHKDDESHRSERNQKELEQIEAPCGKGEE